jgi:hypothetical protein
LEETHHTEGEDDGSGRRHGNRSRVSKRKKELWEWLEMETHEVQQKTSEPVLAPIPRARTQKKKGLKNWLESKSPASRSDERAAQQISEEQTKALDEEHQRAAILHVVRFLNQAEEREREEDRGLEAPEVGRRLRRLMGSDTPPHVQKILEDLVKEGFAVRVELPPSWSRKHSTGVRYSITHSGKALLVRAIKETDRII